MSVYNHRAMMPAPPHRFDELLAAIREEFTKVAQETNQVRSDYEQRMTNQMNEMERFQQSLRELQDSQEKMKQRYEGEIARLNQDLEKEKAKASRGGGGPAPSLPGGPPPPQPNIGYDAKHFNNIMNGPAKQPDRSRPLTDHAQHPIVHQPPMGYHSNGSVATSTSQASHPSYQHPPSSHGFSHSGPAPQPNEVVSKPKQSVAHPKDSPTGLMDIDPGSVPADYKIEGSDWFALFKRQVVRKLDVDLVHTFELKSVVCCVKFSPDGRYLAAGCNRLTNIYDVSREGKLVCTLNDETAKSTDDLYIRTVCFHPSGKILVTGAEDKNIRIWDIAKESIMGVRKGHEQDIYSIDFSPTTEQFVSGSGDRTARIWSMHEEKSIRIFKLDESHQKDPGVTSVAYSPDGKYVAAGSLDKLVRIWDAATGDLLYNLDGHKDSVYSVAFMPDSEAIVSGSLDKTIMLRRFKLNPDNKNKSLTDGRDNQKYEECFPGHRDFVLSVACTPDGKWIISGSKDRGVQFWDPKDGTSQFMLQGHRNSVISVAVSPDQTTPLFASGSGDNRARVWSYKPHVTRNP